MDNKQEKNDNSKDIYTPTGNKNQTLITDYFKSVNKETIIKGYNPKNNHYHCVECGIDMGNYPGQLCRYTWCDGIY